LWVEVVELKVCKFRSFACSYRQGHRMTRAQRIGVCRVGGRDPWTPFGEQQQQQQAEWGAHKQG
jgi:hypothetical protein